MVELMRRRGEEVGREDLGLAAFVIVRGVEATIYAAVVEWPEYVEDGRLTEELTALVVGYPSP
jgi:hypothetical protein